MSKLIFLLVLEIVILLKTHASVVKLNSVPESNSTSNGTAHNSTEHSELFKVVDWKFEHLKNYFIFGFFIVVVVIMKIIYFHIPKLKSFIPESCVLVFIGILFGLIIKFCIDKEHAQYFKLTPDLFFFVLLPPIVLESAYSLYHKNFEENLLPILVFAVFGTLLNFLGIGLLLWGLCLVVPSMKALKINIMQSFLFSSLIVAVDPVAVLAIFKEVGVNEDLYYLVFGESLLNDAVTVVLYEMMQEFSLMSEISALNGFLGFLSFFTISVGAMLIGLVIGILSCLTIRYMNSKETEIYEPIFLLSIGYISYLSADVFGWSGIISMTVCGVVQAAFALYSITNKSRIALKRFIKIVSSVCEALIFLFLGVELAVGKFIWHTGFCLSSLALCLIIRFIVTFILSGVVNKIHMSLRNIPLREKIIISYGGLRGAVAFSLAVVIKEKALQNSLLSKEMIITTTLFIILFSIFVQGISIKPIVKLLKITKSISGKVRLSLFDELNDSVLDTTDNAVSAIIGKCGHNYVYRLLLNFTNSYLRPYLQRPDSFHSKMESINDKINLAMIMNFNSPQNDSHFRDLPNSYKNLMKIMVNQQKILRPLNKHENPRYFQSMSDTTGDKLHSKPIKRLRNYLYRASQMSSCVEPDPWEQEQQIQYIFKNTNTIIKAKNKFLNLRKSVKNQQPGTDQPEESTELVEINHGALDQEPSQFTQTYDFKSIDESDKTKFY